MMYSFQLVLLICVCLAHYSHGKSISGMKDADGDPVLYDENDDVESLNSKTYMSLYGRNQAAFVEFYSHWCGACQRYSKHWKAIATETKQWHSKVMRVAAINCADPKNFDLCKEYDINYYPCLKLIPANAKFENKDHDATLIKTVDNSELIKIMIDFLTEHKDKPAEWPALESYASNSSVGLFPKSSQSKYALLVVEKSDSYLGRKLMLEFSELKDQLHIYRTTDDNAEMPQVYAINNNKERTREIFDEAFVEKFTSANTLKVDLTTSEELKLDDSKDHEKFINLINKFIKHLNIDTTVTSGVDSNIDPNKTAKLQTQKPEKNIFMQDLESGLHMMLRSDIASNKNITGEKMSALKEVLRILSRFFPGREPVKNYLAKLYNSIKDKNETNSLQWKSLTDDKTPTSYLPANIEWRHCRGSTPIYRGYPCALWTIFHILTVSQVDQAQAKLKPFTGDFDVNEVVNAIRLYVLNFFTCKECVQNFQIEIRDWKSHLTTSYDAMLYMWKIHNQVNERLMKEDNNDPAYPKKLFPSKHQCPKCYKPDEKLKVGESPFVKSQVRLFLQRYYTKARIDGVTELETKKELNQELPADLENIRQLLDVKSGDNNQIALQFDSEKENDTLIHFSIFLVIITVIGIFLMFYGYNSKRSRVKAHII